MSSWLKKPIVGFAALVIALSAVGVYLAIRSDESVVASWSSRPESPVEDAVTTFDASASTGDVPIRCLWQFENETGTILHTLPADGVATATECRTTFTFPNPGVKHVRLVAFDADDDTDNDLKTFTVATAPTPTPPPRGPQPIGVLWNGRALSAWIEQSCPPYTDVTEMTDSTGTFMRMQVNASGEPCWGPPGNGNGDRWRAQVIPPNNTPGRPILRGSDRYYDWGQRYPAQFPLLANSHCDSFALPAGSLRIGCSGNTAFHPDNPGQGVHMPSPMKPGGWFDPMQKGHGWYRFVAKIHHDLAPNGRVTLWVKEPGASTYVKVLNNYAHETWNNDFFNVPAAGAFLVQSFYHSGHDAYPPGTQPWVDQLGAIISTCHQVDPAC